LIVSLKKKHVPKRPLHRSMYVATIEKKKKKTDDEGEKRKDISRSKYIQDRGPLKERMSPEQRRNPHGEGGS